MEKGCLMGTSEEKQSARTIVKESSSTRIQEPQKNEM